MGLLSVDAYVAPSVGDGEAKERVQFRSAPRWVGGFASDRLGIGRCMGGPPPNWALRGHLPKVPKWGVQKATPQVGPLGSVAHRWVLGP